VVLPAAAEAPRERGPGRAERTPGADRVVDDIKKHEGKAVAVQADLSKPEEIKKLFAEAKKAFGRLDVLINNAGVYEFARSKPSLPSTSTSSTT
jgi:NAD(P)-dependent dehydrogenase (short-subunit alcohol dehydrogenase family)